MSRKKIMTGMQEMSAHCSSNGGVMVVTVLYCTVPRSHTVWST